MGKAVLRPDTRLNPNWWLYRLPIILGCSLCFLSIFRLVVGILLVLFSWRSSPYLEGDRQDALQDTKPAQVLAAKLR